MWESSFLGALTLTPKFYVALTGTSSLISGLILIFEWWYFRKYGTSFIEQVSLAHLGPWLGGVGGGASPPSPPVAPSPSPSPSTSPPSPPAPPPDGDGGPGPGPGRLCRNPTALLRGAEYARLWTMARRAPLTYYDMNLTAQEHQAWFGCVGDGPAEEALGRAWREREPSARVAAAREALRYAPDCAAALLLLAEEDAPTVLEAERVLRRAWRAAEASLRGGTCGAARARDAAVLAHVKRRAAACHRRLGRLRCCARTLRSLARAAPPAEELLEVLLEQRLYPDAAALLLRAPAPGGSGYSAAWPYTRALLRARAGAPDAAMSVRAALAANPHVPEYLLEQRALSLPPEHVVRGGRSEALAYAFFHLRHWRLSPAALVLLEEVWRSSPPAPAPAREDRELLAGGGGEGCGPGGEGGWGRGVTSLSVVGLVCACAAMAAAHEAPRWSWRAHALARRLWPVADADAGE